MNKGAMSTSRVAEADAMAVDEAGGVAPSREWMQAAQRALETDGILDGSPSKRHKVCICICTLMSQHTCTPKLLGESLSEDVPVRVSRAYILLERTPNCKLQTRNWIYYSCTNLEWLMRDGIATAVGSLLRSNSYCRIAIQAYLFMKWASYML